MGIIWKCYVSDPQPGIDLELLIDDRSGKMLSFRFTRYGADPGAEEGYRNEEEINKEIQEDLRKKATDCRLSVKNITDSGIRIESTT